MDLLAPIAVGHVEDAVHDIRQASLTLLRNPVWLETHLLPRLGLDDEAPEEFPPSLHPWCGFGLKSRHYPKQFSRYLCFLAEKGVRRYLEIGARHGGTFIITTEYLRRFNPLEMACAIDLVPSATMQAYARSRASVLYWVGSSVTPAGHAIIRSQPWDLALIDGDPSLAGCWADYQAVRSHARIVALQDVAGRGGVGQVWNTIRGAASDHRVFEQTDQYEDVVARTGRRFRGIGAIDFGDRQRLTD